MPKNVSIIFAFGFNLLACIYLLTPLPELKSLPNSAKSNLPGDTVQLKNVSAYYTNLSRTEVMNFYKATYYGLFRINLNHPPEHAKEIIRDTTQSYYFEEFVLPFRGSLFINGYEWEKDVFTKPEKRQQNKLLYEEKEYKAKITLKTIPVPIANRFIAFFTTEIGIVGIFLIYRYLRKND